jgi:MYXO-CTERM domain-containing protein
MAALAALLFLGMEVGGGVAAAPLAPDPAGGNWTVTEALIQPHVEPLGALLLNGKVLVAGGHNFNGQVTTCELYDPATRTWSTTGSMVRVHQFGTATLLQDGRVLVVGGAASGYLASAELYDPVTGTWSATGSMAVTRSSHSATLLPDGRVLVAGGWAGSDESYRSSAELYDPATGTWTPTGSMLRPRWGHSATLLPDGKVLVAGGIGGYGFHLNNAELYDPATGTWSTTGSLSATSSHHRAVLLRGGKVLVMGGIIGTGSSTRAELYDPTTGTWTLTGSLTRYRQDYFTATLLPNGKVLVAGGWNGNTRVENAELYDPATGTWSVTGSMNNPRYGHIAALLPGGRVLVAGGAGSPVYATEAELYLKVPDTLFGAVPPASTNQREASFQFHSDDEGTHFECSLGAEPFSECTSPVTFADLAEGTYTFRVRALDTFGNADATPASHTWTVDLTPPDTLITSAPATASQATATFRFSSEADARFECSLDDAPFTPCTSPATYVNLTDGAHAFRVRTRDTAGNVDATPASHTWTVDLTAPVTTFTSAPSAVGNQRTARFTFASNEAGVRFRCSLQWASPEDCTSPVTFTGLDEGSYSFQVFAIDAVGNEGAPTFHSWTVDLTAPQTGLDFAPSTPTNQTQATFSFFAFESDARFECSLDGAPFSACASPVTYVSLSGGTHTFQVRARDTAGNVDATPASYSWTVDRTAPATTLTSTPSNPSSPYSARFAFESNEVGARFECKLDGAAFTECFSPVTLFDLSEGSHTFQVRARDGVGNVDATPAAHSWRVDATAPVSRITSAPSSLSNQATVAFSFESNEAEARFECSVDGADFTDCTSPATVSGLDEGPHTFQVRAKDGVGNVEPTSTGHTWTVDLTAPATTLTSAPSSPSAQPTATFTFSSSAEAHFECSLDGAAFTDCTSPATYANLSEGNHTFQVRAKDEAGNADATPASHIWTVDLPAPEQPESPEEGGGCSAGPGDASWLLASLSLLAVVASRRRQRVR